MGKLIGMCFDRRVLGGLAVVAVGVWLYAPQLLGAALPILLVLICPLSMVLMAWAMRGSTNSDAPELSAADRLAALEREQARLNAEVTRARAELAIPAVPASSPSVERAEGPGMGTH